MLEALIVLAVISTGMAFGLYPRLTTFFAGMFGVFGYCFYLISLH